MPRPDGYVLSWFKDMPIHYTGFNCGQCWLCEHCVGQVPVTVRESHFEVKHEILLPECSVTGLAMTHVFKEPCSKFRFRKERTDDATA